MKTPSRKTADHIIVPAVLIELRPSTISGVGVFAVADIDKDQKVADGISADDYAHLIPWSQFGRVGFHPDVLFYAA